MMCRHCDRRKAQPGKRKLCFSCYWTPAIRALYPSSGSKFAPRYGGREPTAAEVEALVAEQMRCLPTWWPDEVGKD